MRRSAWLLAAALAGTPGCSVNLSDSAKATAARNTCDSPSQCGSGTCRSGACVAYEGVLSTLLLEVAPPLSAPGVGGVRSLLLKSDLERPSDAAKIELRASLTVHGFVRVPDKSCSSSTFPVRVTLTPREESYGLGAVSYVADTVARTFDSRHVCYGKVPAGESTNEFVVDVPGGDGTYDIYVEPLPDPAQAGDADGGAPQTSCRFVPHLFPSQPIGACLGLAPSAPTPIDVRIPWPAGTTKDTSLDGWSIDVVHPLSGHVLSSHVVLGPGSRATDLYEDEILVAPVVGDDPGKNLVRLSPPAGLVAPVVQAELSVLQATDAKKAVFPQLGPFPGSVPIETWVWEEEEGGATHELGVAGSVTFTSTKLDGIRPGILASYSTTVKVEADGKLAARVMPGEYRVRALPSLGQSLDPDGASRHALASSESTLKVACEHDAQSADKCATADPANPPATRAVKALLVPRAASVRGSIVNAVDGTPFGRATVQAVPASVNTRDCTGTDASTCASEPLGILNLAFGEDAFVARPASAIVEGGNFTLSGVDCGGCTEGAGAAFDLSVRPDDGTSFPWLVRPGVEVAGDLALGSLEVPLPVIHRGVVEIPQSNTNPVPVANALISAYAFRDQFGVIIQTPENLTSCETVRSPATSNVATRCIRSVLQVATTRADSKGSFTLVLPSAVGVAAAP